MAYRMKLSTAELVDVMYNWWATYGLESIGYERTAFTEGMKAYLDSEARRRNKFVPLVELSHRQTNKQIRIQQSLEPRYGRKAIYHLTVAGVNQCTDLEEELLSFPKSPNDDTSDSAAYRSELAHPPAEERARGGGGDETTTYAEPGALGRATPYCRVLCHRAEIHLCEYRYACRTWAQMLFLF